MSQFFEFERDFIASLRCIPMSVRFKLDTCGIKLKLTQWHQFTSRQREELVEMPCQSAEEIKLYRQFLESLVLETTGTQASTLAVEEYPAWLNEQELPASVEQQADKVGITINSQQWQKLTPLQRFVLIKLSRASHENHNFLPACQEFGVV